MIKGLRLSIILGALCTLLILTLCAAAGCTTNPEGVGKSSSPPSLDKVLKEGIKPNELGMVMIVEYHWFGENESEYTRSYENFKKDLSTLYRKGYRLVKFTDLVSGRIDLPAGTTPILLSFDDSTESQFRYIQEGSNIRIDPQCAIGIMKEFYKKYPDFGFTGLFNILPSLFEQPEYYKKKIKYLKENGFEFGNHTEHHYALAKISEEEIKKEIARPIERMKKIDSALRFVTLCLPYNSIPENTSILFKGSYGKTRYSYKYVIGTGGSPFYPVYHYKNPGKILPRVLAVDYDPEDGSGYKGLDYWIRYFDEHPELRFISDGDPNTISAPAYMRYRLDTSRLPRGVKFLGY